MKIVVIGGGMSGMVCGIMLSRNGHNVTIIERNSRLGKKISVTGNGRCNISNTIVTADNYNKTPLVDYVLSGVSACDVDNFLDSIGIFRHSDSMGRVYPITDNANSVVDCMRIALDRLGVSVVCDSTVEGIMHSGSGYIVTATTGRYSCDKVVLCVGSGSGASPVDLKSLVGNNFTTKLVPSLVPITTVGADKTLNGIRAKVDATLFGGGNMLATNSGEVLFKDYGLSGICIFDLSAVIAECIKNDTCNNFSISLDILPSIEPAQLQQVILDRLHDGVPTEQLLLGLLHNKLALNCINRAGKVTATAEYASKLVNAIKNHTHTVGKLLEMAKSQVTCGGVASSSVSSQLQLANGIYCCGEVLDVNGKCGGYNLHYAIRSALHVCSDIGE